MAKEKVKKAKAVDVELVDETVGKEIAVVTNTPGALIAQAIEKGSDLTKLQTILDLQIKWEANEAKKAYVAAMAAFKADPPEIIRDKTNKQYDSRYSSLDNFVNAVIPSLSDHGLSHNWGLDQSEGIKVTCTMTHALGHSESTSMTGPPDESGAKNPIQQIKSTVTYLRLSTLEAITGLASKDGSLNDDGNAAGTPLISEDQAMELADLINENIKDKRYTAQFLAYMKADSIDQIPVKQFKKAETAINTYIKAAAK